MSFEDQQICHKQNYTQQELSLLTGLVWEVHRNLNNFVESQIIGNISNCNSQENHNSPFPRFYQGLIVVILVFSLSILN